MQSVAKLIKPWKEAGSANAQVNLYGFWNETAFLTKSGDLGMILRLEGVDYESLDTADQNRAVKRLSDALKAFTPGFRVYQYLFKTNRPEIPSAQCVDPLVQAAVEQRRAYFEAKRDHLYKIEIVYVFLLEGDQSKQGIIAALRRLATEPAIALRNLRDEFSSNGKRTFLRRRIAADLVRLERAVASFTRLMGEFTSCQILKQEEQLQFLRRLINFDAWRIAGKPRSTQFLDYQVVNSDIDAERDHLRVGDHYVRLLTMKEAMANTQPLVLNQLLKVPASFYAVAEWMPIEITRARKNVNGRRRHLNSSKAGASQAFDDGKSRERDQLIDESKQADIERLGDCLVELGDGQTMGDYSFTVVLHGHDLAVIDRETHEFTSIFTEADGALFKETYNQLNVLFACIPGNYRQNLRRMALLNTNYADLSFLFTILPGQQVNAHLGTEYLAVLETDNGTPYFLNLHHGEVAHTLILGRTGSGKSFLMNFLVMSAQKYTPQTYIFDIGGSFESLTRTFGGAYLNAGRESRDFSINPFSLEATKENLQFLFSLFRVLIEGNDRRYRLEHQEERKLWNAVERMFQVPVEQRTLSTFASLVGELKDRLHKWTAAGQYGFLFDNQEDTLSFSSFQTFNFAGWSDTPEVLEPLLFYVLHRAGNAIKDPSQLGTFKAFLIDEAWHFIKNETIREYVVEAMKTWRKHNAAMILATQSVAELEKSGILPVVVEQLATTIFLANPKMNREVYAAAFHLNDTELDLIASLVPPGEMLIRKEKLSKKVRLNVDAASYWIATNNASDNQLKAKYLAQYGVAEGIRRLAVEHDPATRTTTRAVTAHASSETLQPVRAGR